MSNRFETLQRVTVSVFGAFVFTALMVSAAVPLFPVA